MKDAKIRIFDEALNQVDAQTLFAILSFFDKCAETILFSSHYIDRQICMLFDAIIVMKDGKIYRQGTFNELCQDPYFKKLFKENIWRK